MRLGKALVPSRYIAAIYVIALVLLAFYGWRTITKGAYPPAGTAAGRDYATLKRYTGYTSGDIIPIGIAASPQQAGETPHSGRGYKVIVVYSAYREGDTKFFTVGSHYARYGQGSQIVPVEGRPEPGPAIICIGHNRYAFIAAPTVERPGFLGIGRREKNRIYPLQGMGADLDTSFYSTDCEPPDAAVLDAASAQFQVYLPPA